MDEPKTKTAFKYVDATRPDKPPAQRWRLNTKDMIKALEKMPEGSALWSPDGLADEALAKDIIKKALWEFAEPLIKGVVKTPVGTYVEQR